MTPFRENAEPVVLTRKEWYWNDEKDRDGFILAGFFIVTVMLLISALIYVASGWVPALHRILKVIAIFVGFWPTLTAVLHLRRREVKV